MSLRKAFKTVWALGRDSNPELIQLSGIPRFCACPGDPVMAANPPLFLALANLKQAADIPGLPGFPALAVYQVPRKFISSLILGDIKKNNWLVRRKIRLKESNVK
jgi:hypothetical protein